MRPADGPAGPNLVCRSYGRRALSWLWQWRLLATGTHVIGLEPANCAVKPRDAARQRAALPLLAPGERVVFRVEIGVRPRTTATDVAADLPRVPAG